MIPSNKLSMLEFIRTVDNQNKQIGKLDDNLPKEFGLPLQSPPLPPPQSICLILEDNFLFKHLWYIDLYILYTYIQSSSLYADRPFSNSTKMCIKFCPLLALKSADWALDMLLILMLRCWCCLLKVLFWHYLFKFYAKVPNIMQICSN